MLNHVRSWLYMDHLSRPVVVLDGLPGLYGFKYDSATACGLPLYLYSYKLVGSATAGIRARFNVNCHKCIWCIFNCGFKLLSGRLIRSICMGIHIWKYLQITFCIFHYGFRAEMKILMQVH